MQISTKARNNKIICPLISPTCAEKPADYKEIQHSEFIYRLPHQDPTTTLIQKYRISAFPSWFCCNHRKTLMQPPLPNPPTVAPPTSTLHVIYSGHEDRSEGPTPVSPFSFQSAKPLAPSPPSPTPRKAPSPADTKPIPRWKQLAKKCMRPQLGTTPTRLQW